MLRILNSFGYKNVISGPTRITANSKSLIDLIITSDKAKIKLSGQVDFGISDHHLVYCVFKLVIGKPKPTFITVNDYKKTNTESLRKDFEDAPWHLLDIFEEVEDSVFAWNCLYSDIVNQHVRKRKAKIRQKSLPWIDSHIRKEMNIRYKYLREAQSLPRDDEKWTIYKAKRNEVNRLLRRAESDYWKRTLNESSGPKDFWRIVKHAQRKIIKRNR